MTGRHRRNHDGDGGRTPMTDGSGMLAECPVCGEMHEWSVDEGLGGAFDQGWVRCPEYGEVSVSRPQE